MGWQDAPEVSAGAASKWASAPEVSPAEQPSIPESMFFGGVRGASLGFAPKMEAGYKALAKRLLPKSLGGTDKPMGAQYDEDLAAAQGRYATEKAANPTAYAAAE